MRRKSTRLHRSPIATRTRKRRSSRVHFFGELLERRNLLSAAGVTATLLHDLNSTPLAQNPNAIADVGNTLYFSALAPGHQTQLWARDLATGTNTLVGSYPDDTNTDPILGDFTVDGSRLYYTVSTPTFDTQLWTSDGTAAGTTMLASASVSVLTSVGANLFFMEDDQLWKSDGTAAGTTMLLDGGATDLTAAGTTLYFAHDNQHWKSDGTASGTTLVDDTSSLGTPQAIFDFNGTIYFGVDASTPQVWKTDGTQAGTAEVAALAGDTGWKVEQFYQANGILYFGAGQVTASSVSSQLWTTDGTAAGTTQLAAFNGSGSITQPDNIVGDVAYNGSFYFLVQTALEAAPQIWVSQGTAATTKEVTTGGGFAGELFVANGTLYYQIVEGGLEWLNGSSLDVVTNLPISQLAVAGNGTLLFLSGATLYKSGADKSVTPLATLPGGVSPGFFDGSLTAAGNDVYFAETDSATGGGLWHSDGTVAGTSLIVPVSPPTADSLFNGPPVVVGNTAYISSALKQFAPSSELWATDGTPAGTVLLSSNEPSGLPAAIGLGSRAVSYADDANGKLQLWATDGTVAGTQMLTSPAGGVSLLTNAADGAFSGSSVAGGNIFFRVIQPDGSWQLWKSDGTAAATGLLASLNLTVQGAANALPIHAIAAGSLAATEGASLNAALATFRDPNGAGPASDYSAMLNWADGVSGDKGAISGPDADGVFTVTGSHTYAEETTSGLAVRTSLPGPLQYPRVPPAVLLRVPPRVPLRALA